MPDIREILDRAAPDVSGFDSSPIRRRAHRRRAVPRAGVALAATIVIVAGVVVATRNGGESGHRITSGTTPTTSTLGSTTTTTTVPTTTTAPPPTVAPGEDRLSTQSRLGYAGLGPIKLGMTLDDAVAAAHATVAPPSCDVVLHGEPGGGVDSIAVWGSQVITLIDVTSPGIKTISGVEVGSMRADVLGTYPSAESDGSALVITGPEGQLITFNFAADDTVVAMTLRANRDVTGVDPRC
jgi:hypothetical protein